MQRGLVGALLAVLLVFTSFAPYWYPPVGDPAAASWLTAILSVAVILAILVMSSRYGIFWSGFLHPRNYRRAIWSSLIGFVVAWPVEGALVIVSLVLAISGGSLTASGPPPAATACIHLMVIAAVVGAVALIRALILLSNSWWTVQSPQDGAAGGTDGM